MTDDANTNLAAIRTLLADAKTRDDEFQGLLITKLEEIQAGISSLFGQLQFIAGYTGDTRERLNGVILLLDESKAIQAQIRDKSVESANTLDVFNTNTAANFLSLSNFLELMNNNAATNARLIAAAACGDCPTEPPPVPTDPAGYEFCRDYNVNYNLDSTGRKETAWSWNILPGGSTAVPVGGAFYFNFYYEDSPELVTLSLGKFDSSGDLIDTYFVKGAGDTPYEGTRAASVISTKLIIQGPANATVNVRYKVCGNTAVGGGS